MGNYSSTSRWISESVIGHKRPFLGNLLLYFFPHPPIEAADLNQTFLDSIQIQQETEYFSIAIILLTDSRSLE